MLRRVNHNYSWVPWCIARFSLEVSSYLASLRFSGKACAAFAVGLAPDLKQRVEIMAEHVSKNGQEFENTVRSKNAQNLKAPVSKCSTFAHQSKCNFEYAGNCACSASPAAVLHLASRASKGNESEQSPLIMRGLQ